MYEIKYLLFKVIYKWEASNELSLAVPKLSVTNSKAIVGMTLWQTGSASMSLLIAVSCAVLKLLLLEVFASVLLTHAQKHFYLIGLQTWNGVCLSRRQGW